MSAARLTAGPALSSCLRPRDAGTAHNPVEVF
jgi:hypothetical protein